MMVESKAFQKAKRKFGGCGNWMTMLSKITVEKITQEIWDSPKTKIAEEIEDRRSQFK